MGDELKDLIVAKLDITQFLDILGYDLADIIDKFGDEIEEHRQELVSACE